MKILDVGRVMLPLSLRLVAFEHLVDRPRGEQARLELLDELELFDRAGLRDEPGGIEPPGESACDECTLGRVRILRPGRCDVAKVEGGLDAHCVQETTVQRRPQRCKVGVTGLGPVVDPIEAVDPWVEPALERLPRPREERMLLFHVLDFPSSPDTSSAGW